MRNLGKIFVFSALLLAGFSIQQADANPARDAIVAGFAAEAKSANPSFSGFNPAAGETLFKSTHTGGKPDTPSCTSCHGTSPAGMGQTRAGKPIDPMAVSKNPNRYTEKAKVDKWFFRNCRSVLGRECTPQEKGDYLTFMISQ